VPGPFPLVGVRSITGFESARGSWAQLISEPDLVTLPMQDQAAAGSLTGTGLAASRGERLVFSGLDFQLEPGGAVLLKGPNGAGKSTLLRLVAGFLSPMEGILAWNGAPVSEDMDAHRAQLDYLGHLDAVKPVFTVRENVAFWAHLSGTRDDGRLQTALERFDLTDLADQPARFLSAGQKRRTALARLGLGPASLWLLDEPTVSLDAASVSALGSLIADHRARGGMAMIATHTELGLADCVEIDLAAYAGRAAA
jgi:heme exporter protein A